MKLRFALPALLCPLLASAASPDRAGDLYNAIRTNDLARLRALAPDKESANFKDSHGLTPLMYAAAAGSVDAMRFLLAQGADPSARSETGVTALVWSATELPKVRLLLDAGANAGIATNRGRTALLVAAMSDHSSDIVRLLLEHGANPKAVDNFRTTTLRGATLGNDTETIRLLLEAGVDPNAADFAGITPLMMAAGWHGNVAATKLLLEHGAKVNATSLPVMGLPAKNGPSKFGLLTPLLMAAPFGPPELIRTLLDAGADANAKDVRAMTPLMLATATDHQDPEVLRLLVAHGADPHMKSELGESAIDWASREASPVAAQLLKADVPRSTVNASKSEPLALRDAVSRTTALLEKASDQFFVASGCVSCHAQSMTDVVAGEVRRKGIAVDDSAVARRAQMVRTLYLPEPLLERMDAAGAMEQIAYPLVGFSLTGYAPDRYTDAMAANVAAQQYANGSWHVGAAARPPAEEGDIFRTAICIEALKVYAPPARAPEMNARIAAARAWLEKAHPDTAEDRAFQILGLYWAGAPARTLAPLAKAALRLQQPDGGWRPGPALPTDSYSSGEMLYALAKAGISPRDSAYKKGVSYLLASQRPDGTWFERSRSPRIQAYFEGGFPYGHDQWISQWATSWAVLALNEALETPQIRAAR